MVWKFEKREKEREENETEKMERGLYTSPFYALMDATKRHQKH